MNSRVALSLFLTLSLLAPATADRLREIHPVFLRLLQQGRYSDALPLAKEALEISESRFGQSGSRTADALINLGYVYTSLGRYDEALEVMHRALEIDRENNGVDSERVETADLLNNLSALYEKVGRVDDALVCAERALAIREKNFGSGHLSTAQSLNNLAHFYDVTGRSQEALPLAMRAVAIRESQLAAGDPATATAKNTLACVYQSLGLNERALPLFVESLRVTEERLGVHPSVADRANTLGSLQRDLGNFEEAKRLFGKARSIQAATLGSGHPETISSINNLAGIEEELGNFEEAESLFEEALSLSEELGDMHPLAAYVLNNYALFFQHQGEISRSIELHRKALEIRERGLGTSHPLYLETASNLSTLLVSIGDHEQALRLMKRVVAEERKLFGEDHPKIITSLNNLAVAYSAAGEGREAAKIHFEAHQKAVAIFGEAHPQTISTGANLATLYLQMGAPKKAIPFFEAALRYHQTEFGESHPSVGLAYHNLGSTYRALNQHEKALGYLRKGLSIANSHFDVGHPLRLELLTLIALIEYQSGDNEEALSSARQAAVEELKRTENVFMFGSERQRLAYMATGSPYDLFASLGSASDLILSILHYKGVVLDSMVEDKRMAELEPGTLAFQKATELLNTREKLTQLVSDESLQNEESTRAVDQLRDRVETLESELAQEVSRFGHARKAFSVTVSEIQKSLPEDAVLVEFVRFYDLTTSQARYGAVLLAEGRPPKWVPLLSGASEVDTLLYQYRKMVRGQEFTRFALADGQDRPNETDSAALLSKLYLEIWSPIQGALGSQIKTVIISPDSELNLLSFATLVGPDGRFLAEDYIITYVSSGRDLLAKSLSQSSAQVALFGDPDFVHSGATPAATSRVNDRSEKFDGVYFTKLPYTRAECENLRSLFSSTDRVVKLFLNETATEENLRAISSPAVLHLATHGYFLPSEEKDGRPAEDPMLRSGVALAGAQSSIGAIQKGGGPSPQTDGLVNAAEIGLLDLEGTELVCLSACDTGAGERRSGEGVLGLRRGFIQAGARNLVLTLWPVADRETSKFMTDFYQKSQSTSAPFALAQVQRDSLVKLRDDRSLLESVQLVGPFILTFQGEI